MTAIDSTGYTKSAKVEVLNFDPNSSVEGEGSSKQIAFINPQPPLATKKKKRKISLSRDYIFVIWGPQFDEVAATVFITELRQAGLRVKVVSLARQKMQGRYGVALFSDLTLEKALRFTSKAITVIVPCGIEGAKILKDPRFFDFFQRCHLNEAKFFISNFSESELQELNIFPPSIKDFIVYPEHEKLIEFAHQVPHWLPYVLI